MAKPEDRRSLHERIAYLERAFQIAFDSSDRRLLEPDYRFHKQQDALQAELKYLRDEIRDLRYRAKEDRDYFYNHLISEIRDLRSELEARSHADQARSEAIADLLASTVADLSNADVPVRSLVPVSVFIDTRDPDTVDKVRKAIDQILDEADLEPVFETPEIWGSWFKRVFARSKVALTSQQSRDNLGRVERALEMQALHVPQSQIDAAQSAGVANLISALHNTPDALVQIGSILLIKVDGTPIVRNLTQVELSYLERNKFLYKSPKDALEGLSRIGDDVTRFALPVSALREEARPNGEV